ncbi:rhodanese-like domain-containing protein [Mycobacterium sherrisii]|uniref:rhodanese-like domain-containing protein n=1 Tax=Mycobacterium sherrisii TaxID=243061 RepID=UPI000A220584|nr:rhodanese-like domain-containing protein [Mycobacterium sherrisii]MCV7031495.1 sulfurtransferase [Mycobacterium sherrisii]MEC4763140.1 rhodanese-like domain-containing protein [Mycobacterium sherrisii]ORW73965.1 sulfurtransferase [Mycobacterium sherrisii]
MSRIDVVLRSARRRLRRLPATEVPDALRRGAVLVDIRPQAQRTSAGEVPGALVIERNVLEWRCDPTSDARLPQAVGDDVEWVILCSEGYTSSLAAAALLDIGLYRATDVVGGYRALADAGVLTELAGLSQSLAWSSGRSRAVLSGVQPGGDNTAAQPSATSAT